MTTVLGYTNRTTLQMKMLANMRWQIDDLQRQLATGKRADTYAALGLGRSADLEARMQMSRIESYDNAIYQVDLRVNIMDTTLDRFRTIGRDTRKDVSFPIEYELIGNGQTQAQSLAGMRLDEALSLLNERAGERYLFSGTATDTRPTESAPIRTTSPSRSHRCGLRAIPTPAGVPVAMTSPTSRVHTVDSTGAGDAYNGALAAALAADTGRPFAAHLRFASRCAALSTERHGAALSMPARGEVDRRFLAAAPGPPSTPGEPPPE